MKKQNQEVYYPDELSVNIGREEMKFLKKQAGENNRKRARICLHQSSDDLIHEMVIIHYKSTYVRPHKHVSRGESFHVLEGVADIIQFDEKGNIENVLPLGTYQSGLQFYCRMDKLVFHSLVIKSDFLIFKEVTKGPFDLADTVFPPWAPDENDRENVQVYMQKLQERMISAKLS